jgi:prophage regulatory protein
LDEPRLISLNECARLTSLSRSALNRMRDAGQFPAAVPMAGRRVAFVRAEVIAWIEARIAARGAKREAA